MKGSLFLDALLAVLLVVLLVSAGAFFAHHRALALAQDDARLALERDALLAAGALVHACPPSGAARCAGGKRFSHEIDASALGELRALSPAVLGRRLGVARGVELRVEGGRHGGRGVENAEVSWSGEGVDGEVDAGPGEGAGAGVGGGRIAGNGAGARGEVRGAGAGNGGEAGGGVGGGGPGVACAWRWVVLGGGPAAVGACVQ